ncbi:hypothetical protein [Massilia brevitalea]|uniref:hypothetical protein n=1 Tax=Massilia brevitalea TaxID=442526 RepID=UPI002738AEEB|nr:hypothetical protein [Massilia brevitalea]
MSSLIIVALAAMAAGLVLAALALKSMRRLAAGPASTLRKLVAWPFAACVLLLGLVMLATAARTLLPGSWDGTAYWGGPVLCCVALTAGAALWIASRTARTVAPSPAPEQGSAALLRPGQPGSPAPATALPYPSVEAGLAAFRARRMASAKAQSVFVLLFAVPLALYCAVAEGWVPCAISLLVTLLIINQCYASVGSVSEAEYRTLPGSTDAAGRHRCVHCGRRGIFRRGAYASNATWSDCSSCRTHLFVE